MDMREMVDTLNRWNHQYYVLDEPAVGDDEWDALYRELVLLEQQTGTVLPDSPTRRVGGAPVAAFAPYQHRARLWSMDKAQSFSELRAWAVRAEKQIAEVNAGGNNLPPPEYTLEYKYDGLTINLTYEGGLLRMAATRGDGRVGEQITEQVKTIRSVPLQIPFAGLLEAQAECIMPLSVFARYNETAAEPLKNPRNGAAGALRNLDPAVTATRRLDAFFYNIGYIEGASFASGPEMMQFLAGQGLRTNPYFQIYKTIEEVIAAISKAERERGELDFQIDGMVVKIAHLPTRLALGNTDKFPRWAVAYKFAADVVKTRLLAVNWEVGRTGKLTPQAELEPVEIGGATVRRATLNNQYDIARKKVTLGAEVWLRRSNDVIPEILGSAGEPGAPIAVPSICPACQTPLQEIGQLLYCPNRRNCPPQALARLVHFSSRDCLDIESFSEKTAEAVYKHLGVRDPADLYSLTKTDLLTLPGFKDKKADKLLSELQKAKNCRLENFINALGIQNVGKKTATDLAEAFGSMERLACAKIEELIVLPEVGDIVAGSIIEYFSNPDTAGQYRRLLQAGFAPQAPGKRGGSLAGLTFVLTGTLPTLERAAAERLIKEAGGQVAGSVSGKTSYVVAGEAAGSKLEKAHALGVKVIGEADLLGMLQNENN